MNTPKLRKKRFLKEPYNYLFVRHEFLERDFGLRETIIIEFMFSNKDSSNFFKYPITAIQQATGISRPVIYDVLKKYMKAGFLEREGPNFRFTYLFCELHEEICQNIKSNNKTYSIIAFDLKEKHGLTNLEYCVLDTYRRMTAGGYLKCSPLYIAEKYNITERYYYQIRLRLQEKGLIEVKNLNFLKLRPEIKLEMENFFNDL